VGEVTEMKDALELGLGAFDDVVADCIKHFVPGIKLFQVRLTSAALPRVHCSIVEYTKRPLHHVSTSLFHCMVAGCCPLQLQDWQYDDSHVSTGSKAHMHLMPGLTRL
jgi:hypothetical protein